MFWVEHQFALDHKDDGETTWREELAGQWDATGIEPPELAAAPEPPHLMYLWRWWHAIAPTRQSGMGLSGILYSEIEAWARLTKRKLERWEIDALRRIDDLYLNAKALQMKVEKDIADSKAGRHQPAQGAPRQ